MDLFGSLEMVYNPKCKHIRENHAESVYETRGYPRQWLRVWNNTGTIGPLREFALLQSVYVLNR